MSSTMTTHRYTELLFVTVISYVSVCASSNNTGLEQEALMGNKTVERHSSIIETHLRSLQRLELPLRTTVDDVTDPRYAFPRPPDMGQRCYDDTMAFLDALIGTPEYQDGVVTGYQSLDWAMRVLDAYGKPGPGLTAGALQFTGAYDQCLATRGEVKAGMQLGGHTVNTTREFGMKYCRAHVGVGELPTILLKGYPEAHSFWTRESSIPLTINWGVCVPESCGAGEVMYVLQQEQLASLPTQDVICLEEPSLVDDSGALFTVCVLGMYCVFLIVCTSLDIVVRVFIRPTDASVCDNSQEEDKGATNNGFSTDHQIDVPCPISQTEEDDKTLDNEPGKHKQKATLGTQEAVELKKTLKADQDTDLGVQQNINKDIDIGEKEHTIIDIDQKIDLGGNTKPDKEIDLQQKPELTKHSDQEASSVKKIGIDWRKAIVRVNEWTQSFSMFSNIEKLLSTGAKKAGPHFECIWGLKVITMMWIIVGHTFTYGAVIDENNQLWENPIEIARIISTWVFHVVGSGHLGVDSFFVMSGFLAMITASKMFESRGFNVRSLSQFYFHRFWRLTPLYMIVLMMGTTLYDHVVYGPLKAHELEEFHQCRTKWWAHLLYVNNFVRPEEKCMTWTWYLAVDMQFYVISPIFIYAVAKNKKYGTLLLVAGVVLCMVGSVVAEMVNGGQFVMMDLAFLAYWSYVYTMPYVRGGAFLVGMLLGVVMANPNRKPLVTKRQAFLIWLLAFFVALFLLFINHTNWYEAKDNWSTGLQATYEAFARPAWSVCIAWVIYACSTGRGGFAHTVLTWTPMAVLSRLTYSVYLLHPVVIVMVTYSRRLPIYVDPGRLIVVYMYLGNLTLTYMIAVVFTAAFESPLMALEKPRKRRA